MTRRLVNTAVTLSVRFDVDGTGTDPNPDSATLSVTAADGTVVVAAGTSAQQGSNPGEFSYQVQAAANTRLDTWRIAWVSALGTVSDTVEIAGGFLFSISDARTALGDQAYSASKIQAARVFAETELERELGYALVPRYTRVAVSTKWGRPLRLPRPYTRAIRSVSIDGAPLTATDLANLTYQDRHVYGYFWPTAYGTVVVGYEHGLDQPPPGAERAALDLAVDHLDSIGSDESVIHPRAESVVTADGTIRLGTGRFGLPAVDAFVRANTRPAAA